MSGALDALHVVLPVLDPGDAASAHTLQLQRLLRDMGVACDVYVDEAHPSMAARCRPFADLARATGAGPGGAGLVYQLAIGSPLADRVAARPEPLVVNSHNVTPERFFAVWEPALAQGTAWGRRQLEALATRASLGLGVSAFNTAELAAAGYPRTATAPFLFDEAAFDGPTDAPTLDRLRVARSSGGADWLFVGRLVPNKAQHDIVKAFAAHRRLGGAGDRLHLLGATSVPRYEEAVRALVRGLGLDGCVEVVGRVAPEVLRAYYAAADVFVCLSEHEGFCVPLLEAMRNDVPVVAFAAGAVPETLGDAGVLLPTKGPVVVATAVGRVLGDATLRAALASRARRRLGELSLASARARTEAVLRPWLDGGR